MAGRCASALLVFASVACAASAHYEPTAATNRILVTFFGSTTDGLERSVREATGTVARPTKEVLPHEEELSLVELAACGVQP
jgi:hypothetical protein